MKQVLEGSQAVAEAVRLAKVQVISAYPITPQTHIVEALSAACAAGEMDARFICVESEHSALAALIGAASGGVRTFTATSGQGLAYMHELLHWAAGARLPIVMAEVNRALAPGWNIWADQTDSLSQRDTGWIQLYCEDAQEVLDTTLCAFRLAETVHLPVMVVLDAFYLSHTYEAVSLPGQKAVDQFLPKFNPRFQLDTANPYALGQMVASNAYMEMRHSIEQAMQAVFEHLGGVEADFGKLFSRSYGPLESLHCADADVVFVVSGTMTGTCRQVVAGLRDRGEKAGMLKIRLLRPFPYHQVRRTLARNPKVVVMDRNCSLGAGGIFAQELRAALCDQPRHAHVYSYVAGLGGREVDGHQLEAIYHEVKAHAGPPPQSIWWGLHP